MNNVNGHIVFRNPNLPFRTMSEKFEALQYDLRTTNLHVSSDDVLICPLCWKEKPRNEFQLEHFIPKSVGGSGKDTTLSCAKCNNDQGSKLDAHLAKYQTTLDAIAGKATLPSKMLVNGRTLTTTFDPLQKHIHIVNKATNPLDARVTMGDFASGGVENFNLSVKLGYIKNNFNTAVLRSAYLILFHACGYWYCDDPTTQIIRNRINDLELQEPAIDPLIVGVRDFTGPENEPFFIIPSENNGITMFNVIIRIKKATTNYLGVFMPCPGPRSGEFFDLMGKLYSEHRGDIFRLEFKLPPN